VIVLPTRRGDGGSVMFDFFAGNSDAKLALYAIIAAGGLMLAFGIMGAAVAKRRDRGPVKWGLISLLFPPLGFLLLICLPKARCRPVWKTAETDATPGSDHESLAKVSEDATPPRRRPSGNGELRHANHNNSAGTELADHTDDSDVLDLLESRITTPGVPMPDTPHSGFEVGLLEPRMAIPDVAPPEPVPSDDYEATLLQPLTAPPSVALPQAGSLAPATATPATPAAAVPAAPRRTRSPGDPTGYAGFQVLMRGEKKIELQCRNCSAVFRRPNGMKGKLERCPECRAVMRIPK
jgi:hypothetical protein